MGIAAYRISFIVRTWREWPLKTSNIRSHLIASVRHRAIYACNGHSPNECELSGYGLTLVKPNFAGFLVAMPTGRTKT
jgi:hypothetical protein